MNAEKRTLAKLGLIVCPLCEHVTTVPAVDRAGWPSGPWDAEPDWIEWAARGEPRILCRMIRPQSHGAWCGYVGVPPGHPWHGGHEDALPESVHDASHRGLTFASPVVATSVASAHRCAYLWWFGFDCAHSGDFMPAWARPTLGSGVYRTSGYVRRRVNALAKAARGAAL